MTITCFTCGRDSGVRAEPLDDAAMAALEAWHIAVPVLGEPFRWYCDACGPHQAPSGERDASAST